VLYTAPRVCPATPGAGGGAQLSVLRESCDATSIASGTVRVAAVISWMLPPACPVTKLRGGGPSGLMVSSCELLSCVDAPSASLHSCKVSSRTKRSISTGYARAATWASEKALCGAGGARTLPCERAVCRCPRCACLLLAAPPALSLRLHALHAPLCSDNVYDVRRPTYDSAGAYVTRRHTRSAYAGSLEPGGSAARAIVLCGKGSSCQRWC
jgi:hypothetical protein